jgi:hypothetical protein
MHPVATPIIRATIKRRYELIPYTYSQALKSHRTAVPPQRWTGWGYESDPEVWTQALTAGDTQYWFGDALLIAGVYEPGKTSAVVYLPKKDEKDAGYLNTNAPFQFLEAGQWHEISSTWHSSIPVIARCGSAVPVGKNRPTTCRVGNQVEEEEFPNIEKDDWRGVEIFPPPLLGAASPQGTLEFSNEWYEDDGISSQGLAKMATIRIVYVVGEDSIAVKVDATKEGTWEPIWLSGGVDIILPVGEERAVTALEGASGTVTDKVRDVKGRRVWNVGMSVV